MKNALHLLYIFVTAAVLLFANGRLSAQDRPKPGTAEPPIGPRQPAPDKQNVSRDSSFSLLVNGGVGFTHANDPHINRWLTKYHYPAQPHLPSSLYIDISAIPVASSLMYSVRLSTILSGHNLSSFHLMAGLYTALVRQRNFLLLIGAGAGFHRDIITLNGDMPADYKQLADAYNKQLCLHRGGFFLEPAFRAFWYPLGGRSWQLGLFGGLGFAMDINSRWKLGYYDNNHGEYGKFKKLRIPADQQKVSEHGLALNAGLSLLVHVH